jgi:hypothetical protein
MTLDKLCINSRTPPQQKVLPADPSAICTDIQSKTDARQEITTRAARDLTFVFE